MIRFPVNPDVLRWARERSGISHEDLAAKFKKLLEWEGGETQPTLKQVEAFALAVHVPVGYLFLTEPPEEAVPIPDFRTFASHEVTRPSPNLLATIYTCQERQDWYRDFVRVASQPELDFVGSATVEASPETVAAEMCETLGFDLAARRECPTWTDALRLFIRQADEAGVLVMVSGVVMSNNRRRLDPTEFPRLRAVRSSRAVDLHQRHGHEGGPDVYARPRACAYLAWSLCLVEPWPGAGIGIPTRGGVVQRGSSGVSGAASRVEILSSTGRAAPGCSVSACAHLQG